MLLFLFKTHFMIVCFLQRITILFEFIFILNTIQASAYLPFGSVLSSTRCKCNCDLSGVCFGAGVLKLSSVRGGGGSRRLQPLALFSRRALASGEEPVHRFQPLLINCDGNGVRRTCSMLKTRPMKRLFLLILATAATRRCLVLYKVQRKRFIRFLFKVKCKKISKCTYFPLSREFSATFPGFDWSLL